MFLQKLKHDLTHLDLVGPVVVCVKADLELGIVVLQPDDLQIPLLIKLLTAC